MMESGPPARKVYGLPKLEARHESVDVSKAFLADRRGCGERNRARVRSSKIG